MTPLERELKIARACVKRCRDHMDDAMMHEWQILKQMDEEAIRAMAVKREEKAAQCGEG